MDDDELSKKFSECTWSETPEDIKIPEPENSTQDDIRVVVGLDFGTTFTGFTCCSVANKQDLQTYNEWHGEVGQFKTNSVLQYDDEYINVKLWGAPALVKKPNRRNSSVRDDNPVELFKLHLGDLSDNKKPRLPEELEYKKAITDYLREIGMVIKDKVAKRWPKPPIKFYEDVLLVVTVPAEYSHKARAIMRECIYKAGLIVDKSSMKLQFTTEPEAAAVYCMENHLEGQALSEPGTTFMIVDCGGGTVDLTTRELLNDNKLGEITERSGDFCGSTFIDVEFIKYLRRIVGNKPVNLLRDNNYGQMQYMIQQFCEFGKIPFAGEDPDFTYELDILDTVPILKQYITNSDIIEMLENDEWVIEIDFESMKLIFEPVVKRILNMIKVQLVNSKDACSAIFLVGGFGESKYLQKRIKQEFQDQVENISVPTQPIAAISRGAAMYGLSIRSNLNDLGDNNLKCVISSRILKYTYGVNISILWIEGDPIDRKTNDGRISRFDCLAKRGTPMNINQESNKTYGPISPNQKNACFYIYYTQEYNAEFCDEPGMNLLGTLYIDLSGSGLDRPISFGLAFGKMEITATAKNELTGQNFNTSFKLDVDD